jgi:lipopolysaccharide transport system ATP-binding protein
MPNRENEKPLAAIEMTDLSQVYRLYRSAAGMTIDALGLNRLRFWKKLNFQTFLALNKVSLRIEKGERVGIIGRNGAGKTTLLKLITQNYQASSGELVVRGRIQSLMDQGVGFHPEFTGRQNIRSALIYNGITGADVAAYEKDILDFVELEEFIDQPIKTYSLGMKARLGFAAATAIKPDILIVDEVLGAGDAYFASKSALRMKNLTKDGVTLLLVSHSNAQILQFCERAIWIEKGEVVADGPALEVVKSYDRFIRTLESQRLNQKNSDSSIDEERSPNLQSGELSRWKGTGELLIESVRMLDSDGETNSVFRTGGFMQIELMIRAKVTGEFPCRSNVFIYSADGRPVCQFTSSSTPLRAVAGEAYRFVLTVDRILIGNGDFVFSPAIYRTLDYGNLGASTFYDLVDRSYSFKVYSDFEADSSLFIQPASWRFEDSQGEKVMESDAAVLGRPELGKSYRA